MAPSKSLKKAEQKALEGKNESQDTQDIIEQYHRQYGEGVLSSSPAETRSGRTTRTSAQRSTAAQPSQEHSGTAYCRDSNQATFSSGQFVSTSGGTALMKGIGKRNSASKTGASQRKSQVCQSVHEFEGGNDASSPPCISGLLDLLGPTGKDGTDPQPHPQTRLPHATPSSTAHTVSTTSAASLTRSELIARISCDGQDLLPQPDDRSGDAACAPSATDPHERPNKQPNEEALVGDEVGGACEPRAEKATKVDESSASAPARRKPKSKMSCTQSTTQSNEGRSYDRHLEEEHAGGSLPSTAPLDLDSERSPSQESGILDEDDTDAVKLHYDASHGDTQPSMQSEQGSVNLGLGSENAGPANWPMPPPETPANPFAKNNKSQLVPASELFKQTQFSTVPRGVSPTSSRPSPDLFGNNFVSPNLAISSPLKAHGLAGLRTTSPAVLTSSPPPLPGPSSSRLDGDSTPVDSRSSKEQVVPESSQMLPATRRHAFPEPMDQYETMEESQRRQEVSERLRTIDEPPSNSLGWSDDEELARRERVRSKRAAATNKLKSITFTRIRKRSLEDDDDDVEVPSTNKKARTYPPPSTSRAVGQRQESRTARDGGDVQNPISVVDSQDPPPPRGTRPSSREAIPETSPPVTTRPQISKHTSSSSARSAGLQSLPEFPADEPETATTPQISPQLPSLPPESTGVRTRAKPRRGQAKPPTSLPPTSSTRSRLPGLTSPLSSLGTTPVVSTEITPATETSAVSHEVGTPDGRPSSPADAKAHRRGASDLASTLNISTPSRRSTRQRARQTPDSTDELARPDTTPRAVEQHNLRTSRLGRLSSAAAHLAESGSTPSGAAGGDKIFQGMVFAISFQSTTTKGNRSSDGGCVEYNGKTESVASLGKKIQQAGGRVLANGFDELFETPPIKSAATSPTTGGGGGRRGSTGTSAGHHLPSSGSSAHSTTTDDTPDFKLTPAARTIGFAALIADGHSRKSKYMQALALGLPCLSARWVTDCTARSRVVDWQPYLLCAGQSSFLGDAIRSRNLPLYYSATDASAAAAASLQAVVERRPLLLRGSNILVVMKKSEESKKMAYVFLARALGATLSRVHTVDEARARLKAAEGGIVRPPYDWVYLDGSKAERDALFEGGGPVTSTAAASAVGGGAGHNEGKKRKKGGGASAATAASAAAAAAAADTTPLKKIRTLSDELVIQSLILGRLIEADEMEE